MDPELARLIPHRPPMVFIDRLLRCDEASGVAEKVFHEGDYGTSGARVLEVALIEAVAQTAAAMGGRMHPGALGMLVGLDSIELPTIANCGELLEIHAKIIRRLGPFAWVLGEVRRGSEIVMRGELKLFTGELPAEMRPDTPVAR